MPPSDPAASFQTEIAICGKGMPRRLRTLADARKFIDANVPRETRMLPRWTFASKLVDHALASGKRRDLAVAERQLRQALANDHWLAAMGENPKAV